MFREEAFARRGRTESLDGLLRVTAPHMWIVLAGLVLVLAGVLVWLLVGSVERTVAADCALARPGERYEVLSPVSGIVVAVLAGVGDTVEAGAPLARVRQPHLDHQVSVARARLEALEALEPQGAEAPVLAAARAELVELEAVRVAGDFIVSPVAGELSAHGLAEGRTVEAGAYVARIRRSDDRRLEALAFLAPDEARLVEAGMRARVTPAASGDSAALEATVREVAERTGPPVDWLEDLGLHSPPRSRLVRLRLDEAPDSALAEGDRCRARVVVSRQAPVRLLATASGGSGPA